MTNEQFDLLFEFELINTLFTIGCWVYLGLIVYILSRKNINKCRLKIKLNFLVI